MNPRDLPDDATVQRWWSKIPHPGWRWIYGAVATFGLRPHEAFHLAIERDKRGAVRFEVLEGKTGPRRVWPLYPEWVEEFGLLSRDLPGVNVAAGHAYLGHCCCNQFNDWEVPFVPYALRHAYSRRGMEFGLAPDFMAKAMGHTLAVHVQTYRAWIGEDAYDAIFNNALKTQGRPRPPEL